MTHEFMRVTGRVRPEHNRHIQVGYDASILRTRKLNQIPRLGLKYSTCFTIILRIERDYDDAHSIRLWKNIDIDWILSLLQGYQTVDDIVGTFRIRDVINYITTMNAEGELNDWSVGLHIRRE